jgi:hypothetical protein
VVGDLEPVDELEIVTELVGERLTGALRLWDGVDDDVLEVDGELVIVPETVDDLDGTTDRVCVGLAVGDRDCVVDDELERLPATELLVVPEVVTLTDWIAVRVTAPL